MTEAKPQAHSPRMFQLDGLRGVAAFMIVFYHLDIVYGIGGPFQRGYLFVDLFFLLSGFVLTVSTEKKLLTGIGAVEFTWARFKRLWPLVAVGAGVAVIRAFVIGMADPLTLLWWLALDLVMLPSLAGAGPFYRYNGPQWTLFYELLANFIHALALKKVPTKAMLALALIMGGWLIYTVRLHGADTMGVDAPTWKTWWQALPRVGFSYVLGVWIGRKYREGLRTPSLPWWLAVILPIVGIAAVPYLPLGKVAGDLTFVIAFLPVMMWLVAMAQPPQAMKAPMEWLGNYSLPLYCVHLTVLVWTKELAGSNSGAIAALAVATALALSWFFSKVVSFASKPTVAKG
ncbi:MAG TPA: acyltransferase [Novosphingobium sp.]|nr:acyltransferase [Novosphingobium sp.]HQA17757.1 acyltransferase [Novosphingobium sp.]